MEVPPEDTELYTETGRPEMKYLVVYEKGPTSWGAYVPDLPGCAAVGESREEVKDLIKDAIEMHLKAMQEDGDPIPEPSEYGLVEVAV
jgi:predicted RNase H-like HicB family nuclease